MSQFKTVRAFSFTQPHTTLTFSGWQWKQKHLEIWFATPRLQRRAAPRLPQLLPVPLRHFSPDVPSCSMQSCHYFNSSPAQNCLLVQLLFSTKWILMPILSHLLLHDFYRWSYRAIYMIQCPLFKPVPRSNASKSYFLDNTEVDYLHIPNFGATICFIITKCHTMSALPPVPICHHSPNSDCTRGGKRIK